jgi:hypothetical protein
VKVLLDENVPAPITSTVKTLLRRSHDVQHVMTSMPPGGPEASHEEVAGRPSPPCSGNPKPLITVPPRPMAKVGRSLEWITAEEDSVNNDSVFSRWRH